MPVRFVNSRSLSTFGTNLGARKMSFRRVAAEGNADIAMRVKRCGFGIAIELQCVP